MNSSTVAKDCNHRSSANYFLELRVTSVPEKIPTVYISYEDTDNFAGES